MSKAGSAAAEFDEHSRTPAGRGWAEMVVSPFVETKGLRRGGQNPAKNDFPIPLLCKEGQGEVEILCPQNLILTSTLTPILPNAFVKSATRPGNSNVHLGGKPYSTKAPAITADSNSHQINFLWIISYHWQEVVKPPKATASHPV